MFFSLQSCLSFWCNCLVLHLNNNIAFFYLGLCEHKKVFRLEEVSQNKIPIAYNIFFCGTYSTSAAEEEAPVAEEDALAQTWKLQSNLLSKLRSKLQ